MRYDRDDASRLVTSYFVSERNLFRMRFIFLCRIVCVCVVIALLLTLCSVHHLGNWSTYVPILSSRVCSRQYYIVSMHSEVFLACYCVLVRWKSKNPIDYYMY